MARGGARARSGPAPDPNALRRERDEGDWKVLPIDGRKGAPPKWPLGGGQTAREKVIWAELWKLPQAIMWEKLNLTVEVALYARRLREAEKPKASAALANLVMRSAESLGLTVAGLARNKWMIDHRRTAARGESQEAAPPAPDVTTGRARFTVVPGGGGS